MHTYILCMAPSATTATPLLLYQKGIHSPVFSPRSAVLQGKLNWGRVALAKRKGLNRKRECITATPETKQSGFEPSPWGDFFIEYEPHPLQRSEESMMARADKLKEDVRMMFSTASSTTRRLILLDTLQHLGIDHHFEEQIHDTLRQISQNQLTSSASLYEEALRFRLLREHGHWVSPDVFNKFKGEDGTFKKDITSQPRGLLSLYNAAHLLIHGEPALEEAITFSRHHLELMYASLKAPLAQQVKRALHIPLPRTCKRVEALHYISEFEEEEEHNPIILELAKLDFNLLQHVHLKELKAITEWWKNLYDYIGLSYIRDRGVECYTWAYVIYHESCFELPRIIVTKVLVLITIFDDTYDTHATIEECRKIHEAVQRWDESAVSLLPEYFKKFYIEFLRNFKNIEDEMPIDINYDISYLKEAFQNSVTAYLQEAEWSHKSHRPSFIDQVNLTCLSVGAPTVCVSMMVGMSEQALKWTADVPDVVIATGKIGRFMNDIAGFECGKRNRDVASSVECYITEYCVTSEVAIARIYALIEDEWRTLNRARFDNRALLPAVQRIINSALSGSLMYDNKNDVFTASTHLMNTIEGLFVKPMYLDR
uniref:Uncharacterized protein n=1 Tax=Avena sativa TaxID=4498 RepID=A0ACD6A9N9_AVESA